MTKISTISLPATSTRDQSQDSLLEESINLSKIEPNRITNTNIQSTLNTIDESFDSALRETTSEISESAIPHQTKSCQNRPKSTKISTRDESYDSLLGETNNEASIVSNQSQSKNSSRQEYIDSVVNKAIAKTIADEQENKKSTLEEYSDTLIGEEKRKQNEIPKVKNVGFDRDPCSRQGRVQRNRPQRCKKGHHTDDEEGGE